VNDLHFRRLQRITLFPPSLSDVEKMLVKELTLGHRLDPFSHHPFESGTMSERPSGDPSQARHVPIGLSLHSRINRFKPQAAQHR